jgi:predicted DNA-binding protein with PD1-like motif
MTTISLIHYVVKKRVDAMPLAYQPVNAEGSTVYMLTLTGGVPLHDSLIAFAQAQGVHTATFECLGGVHEIAFSAYDFTTHTRAPELMYSGAIELVSAHGTITLLNDAPHVHTHITAAFRDETAPHGIALVGGHCARALCFAVEITLHAYHGEVVRRALHADTGLYLWQLSHTLLK